MRADAVLRHALEASGPIPNNAACPLLVYPAVGEGRHDLADWFEALLANTFSITCARRAP